jgi:hypothetical protein
MKSECVLQREQLIIDLRLFVVKRQHSFNVDRAQE